MTEGEPEGPSPARRVAIWEDRMRREGRFEEYLLVLGEVQLKYPTLPEVLARLRAMHKMQWREKKKLDALEAAQHNEAEKKNRQELRAELIRAQNADNALWREVERLPDKAAWEAETLWISTHPAMLRWDLVRDKTAWIRLTKDDIARAPNGLCPSRRAACQLMHWVNFPHKFREAEIKRAGKAEETAQTEQQYEEDIGWIEQQLEEVRRARQTEEAHRPAGGVPAVRAPARAR